MNKKSSISHCAITCDNIVKKARERERDKCLMSIRLTTVDLHICAYHIGKGHLSGVATAVFINKITFWLRIKSDFILTAFEIVKVSNHQDHPMIDQCTKDKKKVSHQSSDQAHFCYIFEHVCQ
jgi:hypothetical protein